MSATVITPYKQTIQAFEDQARTYNRPLKIINYARWITIIALVALEGLVVVAEIGALCGLVAISPLVAMPLGLAIVCGILLILKPTECFFDACERHFAVNSLLCQIHKTAARELNWEADRSTNCAWPRAVRYPGGGGLPYLTTVSENALSRAQSELSEARTRWHPEVPEQSPAWWVECVKEDLADSALPTAGILTEEDQRSPTPRQDKRLCTHILVHYGCYDGLRSEHDFSRYLPHNEDCRLSIKLEALRHLFSALCPALHIQLTCNPADQLLWKKANPTGKSGTLDPSHYQVQVTCAQKHASGGAVYTATESYSLLDPDVAFHIGDFVKQFLAMPPCAGASSASFPTTLNS